MPGLGNKAKQILPRDQYLGNCMALDGVSEGPDLPLSRLRLEGVLFFYEIVEIRKDWGVEGVQL